MTKQQEIARLESLINTLGKESYLGPWLESVKAEVESMIRSDIFPDVTLRDSAERVRLQREECNNDCARQRDNTKRIVDNMLTEAQQKAKDIREQCKNAIQRALGSL